MAKGLNEIKIIGNVGQEPEVRNLESGSKVVAFSVATSKTYKNQAGEKQTVTQWHRVVAWRKLAEIIEKYVNKGNRVYVNGEMTYRQYETEAGEKRSISEIVANDIIILTPKGDGAQNQNTPQEQPPLPEEDDDMPF